MNVGDWIGAVQNIVSVLAIILGAIWAYYKFLRGRTFSHRAELAVTGDLLGNEDKRAIRARVTLKNMGLTKLPLRTKVVRVDAIYPAGWDDRKWERLTTVNVLEPHEWVEPQEPIADEVLIPLEGAQDALAFVVQAIVFERRKKGGGLQWTAQQIVPSELTPLAGSAAGGKDTTQMEKRESKLTGHSETGTAAAGAGTAPIMGQQRDADESEIRRVEREVGGERQRHADEEEIERVERETESDESPREQTGDD
jgi:hypothetical protein